MLFLKGILLTDQTQILHALVGFLIILRLSDIWGFFLEIPLCLDDFRKAFATNLFDKSSLKINFTGLSSSNLALSGDAKQAFPQVLQTQRVPSHPHRVRLTEMLSVFNFFLRQNSIGEW